VKKGKKKQGGGRTLGSYAISALSSIFSGIIVASVCQYFGLSMYLTGAITGVVGYMGGESIQEGVNLLTKVTESRLGVSFSGRRNSGDEPAIDGEG
jgi:hypothetical protein